MITFLDGPAAGQALRLLSVPILLRVVQSLGGKWDALDQPSDVAAPREKLFVYILTARPKHYYMRCSPRSASGLYRSAVYKMLPHQPDDATLRDNGRWAAWCNANKDLLMPEWAKPHGPSGGQP